jgi:hypothetical protein
MEQKPVVTNAGRCRVGDVVFVCDQAQIIVEIKEVRGRKPKDGNRKIQLLVNTELTKEGVRKIVRRLNDPIRKISPTIAHPFMD